MVYTLVVHLYAKDDAESIQKLVAKLQEASQVYSNDKETLGWYVISTTAVEIAERALRYGISSKTLELTDTPRFVMQDHKDPRAFTIVERYVNEGSQK